METATKRFIEDAVNGGYFLFHLGYKDRKTKDSNYRLESETMLHVWGKVYDVESKYMPWKDGQFRVNVQVVLLDPTAWQAVGKVRWEVEFPTESNGFEPHKKWRTQMHAFIVHLADGKSIEDALLAIE